MCLLVDDGPKHRPTAIFGIRRTLGAVFDFSRINIRSAHATTKIQNSSPALGDTAFFALWAFNLRHWGFSEGEPPQVWATFYYLNSLRADWAAHAPIWQIAEHAIFWPINNVINKLAFFGHDFVLMDDYIKIVGVYRFMKEIELPGPNKFVQILNAVLGVSILVTVCYQISKDVFCRRIWTLFLYAGMAGWFSWTFMLNHYEPRYWSLVFICWVIGLSGPFLLRLSSPTFEAKRVWVSAAAILFLILNLAILLRLVLKDIPLNNKRMAVAWKLQAKAKEACNGTEHFIWNIPFYYFRWSALPHFIEKGCPRIEVICKTGHDFLCKIPDNPSGKTVVDISAEEIDPEEIFR